MAGEVFTLSIVLKAIDKSTAVFRDVNTQIAKIGAKIGKVGKAMSKNITLPLIAIGAASVKAFAEFEAGMSDVSTLIDTTTESMGEMSASVLEIGRRTPVAVKDLTSALFDVRSAGINASAALGVLEGSARLAVAGLGTTKQATRLVTGALNAFQLEGEEAARVYDIIFKTTKFGTTTIAELERGFGAVAGIVASSNIPLDEYLSSVAALTTTTLKAAEAHTQLKAVILGLQAPSKEARKVFKKLGVTGFEQLVKKAGGFREALVLVREEVKGNVGALKKITGSAEAVNAILGLTGAQGKTAAAALDDMRNGANAVDGAFKKQSKTTKAGLQRTKNALTSVAATIGKVLAPALEKVAEAVADAAKWFDNLDEGTRELIITLAGVAAAIGPVLLALGAVTTILAANPIGVAVTLIAVAAALIIKNWGPIKAFFRLLWDDITETFDEAVAKIEEVVKRITKAAQDVKRTVGGVFEDPSLLFGTTAGVKKAAVRRKAGLRAEAARRREAGLPEVSELQLGLDIRDRKLRELARLRATQFVQRPEFGSPQVGAAGADGAPGAGGSSTVKVEFLNAPPGTRVTQEGAGVDLNLGVQF